MKKAEVLGYLVCDTSYDEVVGSIQLDGGFSYWITINPDIYLRAEKIESLKKIIKKAEFVFPDGIGFVLANRVINREKINRITGADLVERLIKEGMYRFYFVGAKKDVVEKAVKECKADVVGYRDGYFSEDEEEDVVRDIVEKRPDFLLVGMGSPRQDIFLSKVAEKLDYGIGIGVGGVFDVLSGRLKRSPRFMQKLGLEWIYRGIREPRRILGWGRILFFLRDVAVQRLCQLTGSQAGG